METIQTVYQGELRTEARHMASGSTIITDAPVDNQGKGAAFSPTDLLSASLGSCMLTIMGIAARTHGIDIDELSPPEGLPRYPVHFPDGVDPALVGVEGRAEVVDFEPVHIDLRRRGSSRVIRVVRAIVSGSLLSRRRSCR